MVTAVKTLLNTGSLWCWLQWRMQESFSTSEICSCRCWRHQTAQERVHLLITAVTVGGGCQNAEIGSMMMAGLQGVEKSSGSLTWSGRLWSVDFMYTELVKILLSLIMADFSGVRTSLTPVLPRGGCCRWFIFQAVHLCPDVSVESRGTALLVLLVLYKRYLADLNYCS